MATGRVNVGGGGAGLNIFTQMSEPAKKEGIWLKTSEKYKKVVFDNEIYIDGEWNDVSTDAYPDFPVNINLAKSIKYNKKIYVLGGGTNTNLTNINDKIYVFDTTTKLWSLLGTLPFSAQQFAVEEYNGKIYVHGGRAGTTTMNTMYYYDISSNTWTTLGSVGAARYQHSMHIKDGIAYILGGVNTALVTQVHAYDIVNNTTSVTALTFSRKAHTTVTIGDLIYLVGGSTIYANSNATNALSVLDLSELEITNLTPIPVISGNHTSELINGKIYLFGGDTTVGSGSTTSTRNTIYIYDIATDSWSLSPKTLPSSNSRFVTEFIDGKLYLVGGAGDTATKATRVMYFETKDYDNKTVIISRISDKKGEYFTEFVSPSVSLTGTLTRLIVPFDDVQYYLNSNFAAVESYYGDGTQWVKFKN